MLEIIFDAKEKKFTSAEGAKISEPNYVSGDGWYCRVNPDGSVRCITTEPRKDRYFEICCKISNRGFFRVTKMEHGIRRGIKCFRVKNWPVVGVISLTGGPIEKRNAFFNDINNYKGFKKG